MMNFRRLVPFLALVLFALAGPVSPAWPQQTVSQNHIFIVDDTAAMQQAQVDRFRRVPDALVFLLSNRNKTVQPNDRVMVMTAGQSARTLITPELQKHYSTGGFTAVATRIARIKYKSPGAPNFSQAIGAGLREMAKQPGSGSGAVVHLITCRASMTGAQTSALLQALSSLKPGQKARLYLIAQQPASAYGAHLARRLHLASSQVIAVDTSRILRAIGGEHTQAWGPTRTERILFAFPPRMARKFAAKLQQTSPKQVINYWNVTLKRVPIKNPRSVLGDDPKRIADRLIAERASMLVWVKRSGVDGIAYTIYRKDGSVTELPTEGPLRVASKLNLVDHLAAAFFKDYGEVESSFLNPLIKDNVAPVNITVRVPSDFVHIPHDALVVSASVPGRSDFVIKDRTLNESYTTTIHVPWGVSLAINLLTSGEKRLVTSAETGNDFWASFGSANGGNKIIDLASAAGQGCRRVAVKVAAKAIPYPNVTAGFSPVSFRPNEVKVQVKFNYLSPDPPKYADYRDQKLLSCFKYDFRVTVDKAALQAKNVTIGSGKRARLLCLGVVESKERMFIKDGSFEPGLFHNFPNLVWYVLTTGGSNPAALDTALTVANNLRGEVVKYTKCGDISYMITQLAHRMANAGQANAKQIQTWLEILGSYSSQKSRCETGWGRTGNEDTDKRVLMLIQTAPDILRSLSAIYNSLSSGKDEETKKQVFNLLNDYRHDVQGWVNKANCRLAWKYSCELLRKAYEETRPGAGK